MKLKIQETFQETIQGEGALAGELVDFIRLYGCPVGCWFCDTGYSEGELNKPSFTAREIKELVAETRSRRVIISGGEPMANPHLPELIDELLTANKKISIETSGAYWQELPDSVWITLSPKEHLFSERDRAVISDEMWSRCNEIKLIISTGQELDYYGAIIKESDKPVFLQPEWYFLDKTLSIALELLKEYPQMKLSTQLHKFVGIQ